MKDTRIRWFLAVLLVGLLAGSSATAQKNDQGELLLQAANHKQLVEGNLEEAIQIYRRIVGEYASNRRLAAKALVQMGQCYEKLGKAEARKAYERVLREYADQPEAAEARTRLAALVQASSSATGPAKVARQLWAEPETEIWHTATSSDGRYYVYVYWETGDLAIRDFATGETRRLTNKGSWTESTEFALSSVISPDDKQVAYAWFTEDLFFDLRILGLDGSEPRILYSNKEAGYIEPRAWSPDGKQILATFSKEDGTNQIVMVSVADGSVRVLKSLEWRYPLKVSLSPDGRYLAYDFQPRQESDNRDIFLLATDGSREIPLIEHLANDLFPIWTSDGKHVVFNSDRSGSMGAWMIEVVDEKPQGAPSLVKSDMTRSMPLAFTRKGSFVYGLEVGMQDVYVADVDLTSGKPVSTPKKISERYMGANGAATWSPDGQYLAYVSTRAPMVTGGGWGSKVIVIRSLKTGEERELVVPLEGRWVRPRWSPDGRFFLVAGQLKNRWGLYKIVVQTGEISTILQVVPGANIQQADWWADGRGVFYKLSEPSHKGIRLLVRNLETGEEKELYRTISPSFVGAIAPSPDGHLLAFITNDPATKSQILMVMPASGGQLRELYRVHSPESIWGHFGGLAWTPDSRAIVFRRDSDSAGGIASVWLVSPEGGEPRNLGLSMEGLDSFSFRPDGRRLAFSAGPAYRAEVWAMENFLPVAAPTPTGMLARQVWADPNADVFGGPSPDGRYLTFVDWSTGDLAVRDLTTGQKRRLTNKGPWSQSSENALTSALSPDGKQIAYAWFNKDFGFDLRVIGIDGSALRVLHSSEETQYVHVAAWTPDGHSVLALLSRRDKTNQIAVVSVADGSVRVLKTLDWRYPHAMSLSPDGRYVAYDFPPKEDAPERDIFLLATDGSREIPLVEHPSDDRVLRWAPDGKHVLFASDRTGTLGAWVVEVADGKPQGFPELVKPDLGRQIFPIGFTRNGSFFYDFHSGMSDIYTATLDPTTRKVTASATPVPQRFVGSNGAPEWSSDGKYLAYLSRRGPVLRGDFDTRLVVRTLATGEERELVLGLPRISGVYGGIRWSPDGGSLLVAAQDAKGRYGLYRTDVQTGATTPIVREESGGIVYWPAWSPDGKSIFFVRRDYQEKIRQLVVRDLETGQEKELLRTAWSHIGRGLALSADGSQLAFILSDPAAGSTSLKVIRTAGGEPRELLKLRGPEEFAGNTLAWTQDGTQVLFGKTLASGDQNQKTELWRIPAEGGDPQPVGLAMVGLSGLDFHPDGRRIVFAAGQDKAEVWALENFLPPLQAAK